MNFFFSFKNDEFYGELVIPKFQNNGTRDLNYHLYSAEIKNKKWFTKKIDCKEDKNFFIVNKNLVDSHKIFLLAQKDEIDVLQKKNYSELLNLNKFTNTTPDYRANFKIINNFGGFSSYQSDYPFDMTKVNGSIMSSLFSLTSKTADKNFILLRNIFFKPVFEKFDFFIINIKTKKILFNSLIKTNFSNLIELDKEFIHEDCYLFTKNFVGIPIFLSSKNNHLSLEHTLPLHSYILSSNRYKLASDIKKKLNEIIS